MTVSLQSFSIPTYIIVTIRYVTMHSQRHVTLYKTGNFFQITLNLIVLDWVLELDVLLSICRTTNTTIFIL
jgi:hypothetical protein